jgi:YVTN family beta-propeller protein
MIFEIIILSLVIVLSNNSVFAQSLHNKTLYEIIKQNSNLNEISQIDVGKSPSDIAINYNTNIAYVVNSDSDSISIISLENNTKIGKDIPVGLGPASLDVRHDTDTAYVINQEANGISVIDTVSNEVVSGVKFQISPFNSGYIECNGLISPTLQFLYLNSGTNCIAKPIRGFEFLSWEENLKNNSTQLINYSLPSSTIFEQIADSLHNTINYFGINNFLGIQKSVEPEAILNINKFGTFTANFRELTPDPLPPEYWSSLFTVVVTALVGSWLTPTIIEGRKAKKQHKKLDEIQDYIKKLYIDKELDKKDIEGLDEEIA